MNTKQPLEDLERGLQVVRENHMMFIWQLVNLGLWLRFFEDVNLGKRQDCVCS